MTRRARDIDLQVAERLRARRILQGMSLVAVADAIGITYQQVYKYESGANRVSVGRLCELAAALEVPPAELLADIGANAEPGRAASQLILETEKAMQAMVARGRRDLVIALAALCRAAGKEV